MAGYLDLTKVVVVGWAFSARRWKRRATKGEARLPPGYSLPLEGEGAAEGQLCRL